MLVAFSSGEIKEMLEILDSPEKIAEYRERLLKQLPIQETMEQKRHKENVAWDEWRDSLVTPRPPF